jgi:hypothetical protein
MYVGADVHMYCPFSNIYEQVFAQQLSSTEGTIGFFSSNLIKNRVHER